MQDSLANSLKQVVSSLRKIHKPLSIHCEALHIPQVQNALTRFLNNHKRNNARVPTLFCITPVNKSYVEGMFGQVNRSYERILRETYQHLNHQGYPIQLHVHLTRISNLLPFHSKKQIVSRAYVWMRNIGLDPTELALGWWRNEEDIKVIIDQLNLRLVKWNDYKVIHDYEL